MAVERTDLRRYESDAIRDLFGAFQLAYCSKGSLRKRLEAVGKKMELEKVAEQLRDIASSLLRTVRPEKLETIKKNLDNIEVVVRTKRDVTKETNDAFVYVNAASLRRVLLESAKERCVMCIGSECEMSRCSLRKMMDEVLLEDVPENPFRCRYLGVWWQEEGGSDGRGC